MSIKVEKLIKEEETRAAGFLWTKEIDPTWLRFQVDLESGAMKGFHVSRCEGSIPRTTPFLYNFRSPEEAREYYPGIAMAALADIGKETLIRAGEEYEEISMAGQVGAWQDFMGAFGGGSEKVKSESFASSRYMTYGDDLVVRSGIMRIGARGALTIPRNSRFKVGARMSGFDSVRIARTKGLPSKLKVGAMGNPDIDQAQEALKHVERPSSHAVSWYGTRDPEVAKYRLQAAAAFPVLAGLIADRKSLSSAIDEIRAIQPILIETTGLSKASIKRVGKLTEAAPIGRIFEDGERIEGEDALGVNRARHTQISGSVPTDMALRYLSELAPDRTPNDNESWVKFNDILSAVAIPIYNATSIPVRDILEASKGNWITFHASLAKAADFEPENFDRRTMALTTIDALEAIEHFNRTVVLPQALSSIRDAAQPDPMLSREFVISALDASTNLIVGKTKNAALLMMEVSRRYASRIPAMMEIEGKSLLAFAGRTNERFSAFSETAYPKLTEDYTASNGRVVRSLDDGKKLTEESRRLNHCVGGYQSRARRTQCHIFSIQNQSGSESSSTFELSAVDGSDQMSAVVNLRKIQHRAHSNRAPSEEDQFAYKEFIGKLKGGEIQINLDEIHAWREWLQASDQDQKMSDIKPTTTWKSVLELDWENPDVRKDYWKEWGEVLGGKIAKSNNPGVIYTEKKAQELIGAMSPRTAAIMIDEAKRAREERAAEKERENEPQPM